MNVGNNTNWDFRQQTGILLVGVSQLNVDENDGLTLMLDNFCGIGK